MNSNRPFETAANADPLFLFTLRVRLSSGCATIHAFESPHNRLSGSQRIDVEVRHAGRTIFPRGLLYCGTPQSGGMSVDGARARELVLSLVAMKPGDTDDEYFADYTPEQLTWSQRFGEEVYLKLSFRYHDKNGNMKKKYRN
jgi:hypothetical protein